MRVLALNKGRVPSSPLIGSHLAMWAALPCMASIASLLPPERARRLLALAIAWPRFASECHARSRFCSFAARHLRSRHGFHLWLRLRQLLRHFRSQSIQVRGGWGWSVLVTYVWNFHCIQERFSQNLQGFLGKQLFYKQKGNFWRPRLCYGCTRVCTLYLVIQNAKIGGNM